LPGCGAPGLTVRVPRSLDLPAWTGAARVFARRIAPAAALPHPLGDDCSR